MHVGGLVHPTHAAGSQLESAAELIFSGRFEKCATAADLEVEKLRADEQTRVYLVKVSCLRALKRQDDGANAIPDAAEAALRGASGDFRSPVSQTTLWC